MLTKSQRHVKRSHYNRCAFYIYRMRPSNGFRRLSEAINDIAGSASRNSHCPQLIFIGNILPFRWLYAVVSERTAFRKEAIVLI